MAPRETVRPQVKVGRMVGRPNLPILCMFSERSLLRRTSTRMSRSTVPMIWARIKFQCLLTAEHDHVLEQPCSLSSPAPLGIQTCDSEGCFQFVTPTPEVDKTRALALVHRHSANERIQATCNVCEVDDAAHAPRREQCAQEVQEFERRVLRHESL